MERSIANIAAILLFVNCILYLCHYSVNGKAFRMFTLYIISTFFIEIIMRIYAYFHYSNLFLSHFYFFFQLLFLSLFYHSLFKEKEQKKYVKFYFIFYVFALTIQYITIPHQFYVFNLFEIFLASFPIIIYAIIHFYNMLNGEKKFYLVNTGIVTYLLGSTIIFLSGNVINIYLADYADDCWAFNSILYLFFQIILFVEWKKNYSKTRINP